MHGFGDKQNALREAKLAIELECDDTSLAPAAEEVLTLVEVQTVKPPAQWPGCLNF